MKLCSIRLCYLLSLREGPCHTAKAADTGVRQLVERSRGQVDVTEFATLAFVGDGDGDDLALNYVYKVSRAGKVKLDDQERRTVCRELLVADGVSKLIQTCQHLNKIAAKHPGLTCWGSQ